MLASPGVTVHPAIRKPPRGSRPHATTTEAVPQYAPTIPASTTAPASPTTTPPLSFVPSQQSLLPVCQGIDQPRRPARIGPSLGCRIVAAYGNPLSKGMGILGRLPPDAMLADITKRTAEWQNADPARTHRCALELIAISVQASPGPAGLYRAQMGPKLIDQVLQWARNTNCLLILDMQVGHSTVEAELPYLSPWLAQPDVALGLDPEWDMPPGVKPGTRIGTMDATDINTAILERQYFGTLVRAVAASPRWALVYIDARDLVFVRNVPAHAALIQRYRIDPRLPYAPRGPEPEETPGGWRRFIGSVEQPWYSYAMARNFLALGSAANAERFLVRGLERFPGHPGMTRLLGQIQSRTARPSRRT